MSLHLRAYFLNWDLSELVFPPQMFGNEEETQLYLRGSTYDGLQTVPDGHNPACPPSHAKAGVTAKATEQQQALVYINLIRA